MTTNAPTPDDAARENLRAAIQRLEIEAYQHGLRNGRPNGEYRAGHFKPKPGISDPVGADHHAARTEVERLLNTAAKGISLSEPGMVVVDEGWVSWAIRAARMCRNAVAEPESYEIWDEVVRNLKTALTATRTAQDHDGAEGTG